MDSDTLDIDAWIAKFPLSAGPPDLWRGVAVYSADSVAWFEQVRAMTAAKFGDLGPSVPTDVFILGEGEPPRRDMTQIGGVPYRPADKPWPTSRGGQPMTFLAQFRFSESRDFMEPLPGDILLIFIEDDNPLQGTLPDKFLYEWYPLGLTDLVQPSRVPEPYWKFFNGYGIRHRTVDYPRTQNRKIFEKIIPPDVVPDYAIEQAAALFCRTCGVKIGGSPWWSYPDHITVMNGYYLRGRLLCSICGIYPSDGDYPWINHPTPIQFDRFERRYLDFGKAFVINFFIDEKFEITRGFQFERIKGDITDIDG